MENRNIVESDFSKLLDAFKILLNSMNESSTVIEEKINKFKNLSLDDKPINDNKEFENYSDDGTILSNLWNMLNEMSIYNQSLNKSKELLSDIVG